MPTIQQGAPAPQQLPPLATIHAQGFGARKIDAQRAEIVMGNPAFQTVALVTREELEALVRQLTALVDELEPTGPALATPAGAGRLVVPGR